MKLYLVRHGRTVNNARGVFHGQLDTPLDDTGKAQAEQVAKYLSCISFDTAYSSTLGRSIETLDIILHGRQVPRAIDSRLDERCLGVFEGLTYPQITEKFPAEAQNWLENWVNFTPPEGESYNDVYKRVSAFLDDIASSGAQNILAVTHAGVIRTVYSYVCGDSSLFWKFGCRNCDVALINRSEDGDYFIEYIRPLEG